MTDLSSCAASINSECISSMTKTESLPLVRHMHEARLIDHTFLGLSWDTNWPKESLLATLMFANQMLASAYMHNAIPN